VTDERPPEIPRKHRTEDGKQLTVKRRRMTLEIGVEDADPIEGPAVIVPFRKAGVRQPPAGPHIPSS
jgi:hypothetical protein